MPIFLKFPAFPPENHTLTLSPRWTRRAKRKNPPCTC